MENNIMALSILDSSPDTIFVVSEDGVITWVNRRGEEVFGYRSADLIGQKIECLLPEQFRDAHHGYRTKFMDNPTRRPMGRGLLLVAKRKDGTRIRVDVSLSILEGVTPIHVICVVRDLSQYLQP